MTTLVFDIEADGLYQEATRIHCIVTKDINTGEIAEFHDNPKIVCNGTILDGIDALVKADHLIGHNIIDYDTRLITRLHGKSFSIEKLTDTYLRSLMDDPHRKNHHNCPVSKIVAGERKQIGPHSLENWGYVVGRGKVEHEDWSVFTPEMLRRCKEDVEITHLVHKHLEQRWSGWDWSKAEWIEKKFRYIMSEQESYGWMFDIKQAESLVEALTKRVDEIDAEVLPRVPKIIDYDGKTIKQIRKQNGGYYTNFIKWFEQSGIGGLYTMASFVGEFCRISFRDINLNSDSQVKSYLLSVGWIPTEYNYQKDGKRIARGSDGQPIRTSPKLTEDSFDSLRDNTGLLISERLTATHRRSQIEGWLRDVNPLTSRIGAGGNSVGTNTARVTHRKVVNVPKAEDGVFYGKQMRGLFGVKSGFKLCGFDLCALEDRVAGHYTYRYDDGAYANSLLNGDPHQETADLFGVERYLGKRCNHALKYGATYKKLAEILSIEESKAQEWWDLWWDAHPSLKQLRDHIEYSLEKRGHVKGNKLSPEAYVKGIDGRKVYIRSKHSIINALIQNAGSIVNKLTTIYIYDMMDDEWIDGHLVGNFHDESQCEVRESDVDRYEEICRKAVSRVNDFFQFYIPMEGDFKSGLNWQETH